VNNNSTNNKRIAKNTLFLYLRMIFLMAVSLYTSRVVLDKLGVEDFGIYNVVAGFVLMLGFFSSSLSNVTQRFLNIELGKNNIKRAREIFNQHLILYVIIILIVLIIAETAGLYFVKNKLVIPAERLDAALWTYQFALISLTATLLGIVYNSAIIAHEDMKIYSFVGIVEGVARLGIAFLLGMVGDDRLIVYAFLLMTVVASAQFFYAVYCHRKYEECRLQWYWNRNTVNQTTSFVGWNFVGTIIYMLKDQGLNILLNLFCGPVVNAARAVSYQVNSAISSFNSNFVTSVQPQIVKSYASGEWDYMFSLFYKSTKYSLYLMWFLCLPVILYMDELLGLWLKEVPADTAVFTFWILVDSILATMTNAPWIITMAKGDLKKYVLYSNSILILIFPLSYLALYYGMAPVSVFMIVVAIRILQITSILIVVDSQFHYGIPNFIKQAIYPFAKVLVGTIPLSIVCVKLFGDSLIMMFLSILSVCTITGVTIWLLGLTENEKNMAKEFVLNKFFK